MGHQEVWIGRNCPVECTNRVTDKALQAAQRLVVENEAAPSCAGQFKPETILVSHVSTPSHFRAPCLCAR